MLLEKRWFSGTLALIIAMFIFYVSSISKFPTAVYQITFASIAYHIRIFFPFSLFFLAAIKGNGKIKTSHIALALAISIICAISDEFHQLFVPSRQCSIIDVLFDSTGILASTFLSLLVYIKKLNKRL
ncbi:hypothetical protein COV15_00670 [Candidatus Woesearchaeota archaeon CG10_big_fil_rev_8_21_14_0_10_34_12]|nr:MAG: hypothetical protein COV15_00670 [Candidatus Woesearchaeota archaeon CG10_big_fil_rev_8_21_14_0_10_34_12]